MKVNFQRLVLILSALFSGGWSTAQTVLLNESFSTPLQPSGWTQDSAGAAPFFTWAFNNPASQIIPGAGFDSGFAIFNSDYYGQNNSENCYLTLPSVDASALLTVYLVMDEQYRAAPGQWRQVEISNDNGFTWTHLLQDSTSGVGYPNAVHSVYDITSVAAGHSNVKIRFHFAATWGWWWAIDNVAIKDQELCTSPPFAGDVVSTANFSCATDSFSLAMVNYSGGSGEVFQWQSSVNGLTWTDIPGATNSSVTVSQSSATYYRGVLTCNGFSSNSDSVLVGINPNLFCYCLPVNDVCTGINYISNVSIQGTSLNNSSACDSILSTNYSYFAPAGNTTTMLDAGSTYNISVTTNNNDILSVWIDTDHNLSFDANEWTQISTTSVPGTANTVSVFIPATALNGMTGLRIRSRSAGSLNDDGSACSVMGSGETEDYIITIENGIGINETLLHGISVYPSPSHGQIEVKFGNNIFDHASVKIFDLPGNTLMQKDIDNLQEARIDLSALSNGIYFVKIQAGNRSAIRKFVLNK